MPVSLLAAICTSVVAPAGSAGSQWTSLQSASGLILIRPLASSHPTAVISWRVMDCSRRRPVTQASNLASFRLSGTTLRA